MARAVNQYPEEPTRSHPYYELEAIDLPVRLPGRPKPLTIHLKVAGSGPPLLLIHGLMTSSYSFRYVTRLLAETYRVYVPDLPGAGKSEAPTDLSMAPQSVAAVIGAIIEALELDRPYVIGNSLGGYQCLWLALEQPERIGRLMVMHSPGLPILRMSLLKGALRIPAGYRLFSWFVRRNPERFVVKNVHYHTDQIMSQQEAREYAGIFRDESQTRVFFNILKQSLDPTHMRRFVSLLRQRRDTKRDWIPIRLLWAEKDVMVPPALGPRYKELIPQAELIWMSGVSHFMHVDDPAATVEHLLRFGIE